MFELKPAEPPAAGIKLEDEPVFVGHPCSTCAFGEAGGAAEEPFNKLRGYVSALAGTPFYCHHGKDGRATLNPIADLAPTERRVCEGWKAAVLFRFRKDGPVGFLRGNGGDAEALRQYQHHLGNTALKLIDRMAEGLDDEAAAETKRELKSVLEALAGER